MHWLKLSNSRKYPYQVIPSSRAKYVRVKLTERGELSVVIPQGVALQKAHDFVQSRAGWVERHLKKMPLIPAVQKPSRLDLRLLRESWQVDYREQQRPDVMLSETDKDSLVIAGAIQDIVLIQEVIIKWCKLKAIPVFEHMLQQLAAQHGFEFNRLTIRAQKTRWGSCSNLKNINLNCKLVFMPESVVRYVMIHELCHTIEMNHSDRFWSLVAACDPDYQAHRKILRQLSRHLVV